jgi:serpin B
MRTLAMVALLLAAACTPGVPPGETPPAGAIGHITEARSSAARNPIAAATDEQLAQLVTADRAFAFDLYRAIGASEPGNLFISPYSISTALTMVLAGARGETADELARALQADALGSDWHVTRNRLELSLSDGNRSLMPDAVPLTLEPTNAIFGQAGYDFKQEFLDTLAANYGAGMNGLDFAGDAEAARDAINQWVAERTRDRIKELLQEGTITPVTRAVLVNAIYFKGTWIHKFDPEATSEEPFHLLDGATVPVDMMHRGVPADYATGDGWQAVSLPYHGQASMLLIVPEEGRFDEVEELLDVQFLRTIERALDWHDVDLRLPRWETESQLDLVPTLRSLGVELIFDEADLSGIADEGLFVSDVAHVATINEPNLVTEVAGEKVFVLHFIQARDPELVNKPFFAKYDEKASWLFDLEPALGATHFPYEVPSPADTSGLVDPARV